MRARLRRRPVVAAVAAVAAVALVARLALLGERVAHWDEARVAWWVLQYLETGSYTYFPILHGPFLFHANRLAFAVLGPSDASMRLVVALVGAALPLSALSLRTRLGDAETVALAVVLAADPLLLYYSRFARNDLPVAAFAFATFALLVRARDTGRARHGVAAAAVSALALASKENAVLYLPCWLAAWPAAGVACRRAGAPLGDVRGHLAAARAVLREQTATALGAARGRPGALLAAFAAWLVVMVAMFAPRGGFEPSLGAALADPALWPAVVAASTVGAARKMVSLWLLGDLQGGGQAWKLAKLVGVTIAGSLPTVALAAYGLARERTTPRPLVVAGAVWAALSVAGYPLAADIVGGWTGVHVTIALAVPAAVGLAALARRARPAAAALWERAGAGATARPPDPGGRRALLALVVLAGHVAVVGGTASYVAGGSKYNVLGQPAQGEDALKPTVETAVAVAHHHAGVDVAYFGEYWAGGVHRRQPLAWYFRAADHGRSGAGRVRTRVVANRSEWPDEAPPVVVGLSTDRAVLGALLPEGAYVCFRHELDHWSPREPGGADTEALVYVDVEGHARYGSTRTNHRCGSAESTRLET